MWEDIIKALLGNKVFIDDCVDRINRKWVVVICLICLVIIASGQFLRGTQIQCFTPVYFSGEFKTLGIRLSKAHLTSF